MKRPLVFGILSVALACAGCQSGTEAGATTSTADGEIPGMHAPNDLSPITAERWIDQVRIGRNLDVNGRVPVSDVTDVFPEKATIHISMEVTDAPAGSVIKLEVSSQDGSRVWEGKKTVAPGRAFLSFSLDGSDLGPGEFVARVIVGDETVRSSSFTVEQEKA